MSRRFVVARNPEEHSKLPFLLWLPIGDGVTLKAKSDWPASARVFCLEVDGWPTEPPEIVDEFPVRSIRRRGIAVDLELDRGRRARSQFVFTQLKDGRPAVFWQTPKAARAARPGQRVPSRRAQGLPDLVIARDRRERYGYRFAAQQAQVTDATLQAGDYGVADDEGAAIAVVERKSVADLAGCLMDGTLAFQLAGLTELPRAAVVVEGRYPDLLDLEYVQPGFVLDLLARVQVRYPEVPIVFTDSRKMAEEWTYRFLAAAHTELVGRDDEVDSR